MNLKITDLIYTQSNLIPKDKCNYFIDIFEKNINKSVIEDSLKYIEGKDVFRKKIIIKL